MPSSVCDDGIPFISPRREKKTPISRDPRPPVPPDPTPQKASVRLLTLYRLRLRETQSQHGGAPDSFWLEMRHGRQRADLATGTSWPEKGALVVRV